MRCTTAGESHGRALVAGVGAIIALSFGSAYGDGLAAMLEKRYAGRDEPIIFLLHLAHPRVRYTDRGKSALVIQ